MEATHFIEVWKYIDDGILDNTFEPSPISQLEPDLRETIANGHETVAVWRIKPTDVPLQERLAARIGLIGGLCTPEGYGKVVALNKLIHYKFLFGDADTKL